jgi:hypothetical protein
MFVYIHRLTAECRHPSASIQFPFALARHAANTFLPMLCAHPRRTFALTHACATIAQRDTAATPAPFACPPPPLGHFGAVSLMAIVNQGIFPFFN